MDCFSKIVTQIQHALTQPLPGELAQIKMATSSRSELLSFVRPNEMPRQSAVLIAVYPNNNQAETILIKRPVYNGAHSGQVAFPGGKVEPFDKDLVDTALREAEEEVGINPDLVSVLGQLTPLFIPVSNIWVQPVIGLLNQKPNLSLNLQEVEYTISAKLCDLKQTENRSVKTIAINSIPISAPYYKVETEHIWGATAMIISELLELFSGCTKDE